MPNGPTIRLLDYSFPSRRWPACSSELFSEFALASWTFAKERASSPVASVIRSLDRIYAELFQNLAIRCVLWNPKHNGSKARDVDFFQKLNWHRAMTAYAPWAPEANKFECKSFRPQIAFGLELKKKKKAACDGGPLLRQRPQQRCISFKHG